MKAKDVIRAWKDSEYRNSLSREQRAMLPETPALVELDDFDLDAVAGGIEDEEDSFQDPDGFM